MELNPDELLTLEVFTSKGGAFEAVSKIAKEHIEKKRELFVKNLMALNTESNEEVGAKLKAFSEGMKLVEGIFRDISAFRKEEHKPSINRAR